MALIDESFRKYRDLPAYRFMGKRSASAIDDLSRALAAWLQAQGLERGDRVAIMLPNVPQYPVAVAAILRAGLVVVNVNPLYTPRELEHQLKDSGAKAIVILENFAATLEQCIAATPVKHVVLAAMGDMPGAGQALARQPRGAQGQEAGAGVPAARRGAPSTTCWRDGRAWAHAARAAGPTTSPCCSTPAAPPA